MKNCKFTSDGSTINPPVFPSRIDTLFKLATSEILLLDDLGSMKIRDWTLDLLSQVINHRYVNKRILIATTNYVDEPAPTKEDITELEDRIGPRLRSRLNEMCKIVPMLGIDFRETKYQPGLHTDIS